MKRPKVAPGRLLLLVILASLAVLGAACGGSEGGTAQAGVMEGQRAADFQADTLEGRSVTLSGYRGSVVLLNFWATWCPPCELEMPDIEKAYQAHRDNGLVVLAINAGEAPAVVQPFVAKYGLTFPIVMDARGQVAAQYRVRGLPMTIILDRDGVILVRHIGYMSAGDLHKYLARVGLE